MTNMELTALPATLLLYLDPGSGSFIIQLILAGALGLGVGLRLYWAKVKSLFGGKKNSPEQPGGESQDED